MAHMSYWFEYIPSGFVLWKFIYSHNTLALNLLQAERVCVQKQKLKRCNNMSFEKKTYVQSQMKSGSISQIGLNVSWITQTFNETEFKGSKKGLESESESHNPIWKEIVSESSDSDSGLKTILTGGQCKHPRSMRSDPGSLNNLFKDFKIFTHRHHHFNFFSSICQKQKANGYDSMKW